MTPLPMRVLPFAMIVLSSCSDTRSGTEPTSLIPRPGVAMVAMRGTVDARAGTLTFEPLSPLRGAGSGITASIYGNQGVTARIYNSAVTITNPSSPGKKTLSAEVGVRNMLTHPVGDEQGGPVPLDTTGVYVFVSSGPTVNSSSSPCTPTCTVTTLNHHGTMAFNGPSQVYWHWRERIGAAGGGGDTTLTRKTWIFEADTQVAVFSFDVLLSAAWPPPHETRWKVQYDADSLPDAQTEPPWRRTNAAAAYSVSGGVLNTLTINNAGNEFYRLDSVATNANAYIEARVRVNSTGGRQRAVIHFNDGVRYVALGIRDGAVGFIRASTGFPFIANWSITSNTFRTYQLRKYAADSAVIYVDGVRVGALPYLSLWPAPVVVGTRVQFGCPAVAASTDVDWDYVVYEIGVAIP